MTAPTEAELRRLLAEATPGPWHAWRHGEHSLYKGPGVEAGAGTYICETATDGMGLGDADAALIVAAVNALPSLLDRMAALEEANGRLMKALMAYERWQTVRGPLPNVDAVRLLLASTGRPR